MTKLISWVEIPTVDFNRAVNFYKSVLTVDLKPIDYGNEKMACFPGEEGAIINASDFKPCENGALVSFNTGNDIDGAIERIEQNGVKLVRPKTKIDMEGEAYFAVFIDCEGNKVGLYGNS